MTTESEIKEWFDIALQSKATHMIVVCDTYDYYDFPVLVPPEIDIHKAVAAYENSGNMTKVMEVYKMELGWEAQSEGQVRNL